MQLNQIVAQSEYKVKYKIQSLGQLSTSIHVVLSSIETNIPEQLHLHAPLTPRKSYVPRGTIVIIFILGEVFAVSWTIENWFVNHFTEETRERGSR